VLNPSLIKIKIGAFFPGIFGYKFSGVRVETTETVTTTFKAIATGVTNS
jgi:hypothetical protein